LSDNIRSFNDYRKKVNLERQNTEEMDIEIQDPLDFLSASEREEYYRTQHEKMEKERENIDKDSDDYFFDDDFEVKLPEDNDLDKKEKEPDDYKAAETKKKSEKKAEIKSEKRIRKKPEDDRDDDWFDEDDSKSTGINPYLVVRIASIATGIIILLLLGIIFKEKVLDNIFGKDPDEVKTVSVGEVEGYSAMDDTVVTTVQLNLRSTPSTASDSFIVTNVPAGTELKRVALSDNGDWAQVEYEGQRLYCAMKYLTVKE